MTTESIASGYCPECDGNIPIAADSEEGEVLICAECGAELEILSLSPLTLDLAPIVEEDWGE